eukprot:10360-Ditylum_brightwellii.AAC.1
MVELVLERDMPPVLQSKEEVDKDGVVYTYGKKQGGLWLLPLLKWLEWEEEPSRGNMGKEGMIFLQIVLILHAEMTSWRRK